MSVLTLFRISHIARAIAAANTAWGPWRDKTGKERSVILRKWFDLLMANQEDKKNKDWDPNAPLYGKNPAKSADKADGDTKTESKSADPIADFAKPKPTESKPVEAKSVEIKPSEEPSANNDPFIYFVQAGAFRTADEAETQRAKLGFLGLDARLSEREQGGRTVYRVRVGPIDKVEAERVRSKLESAHIESAMVRVQR